MASTAAAALLRPLSSRPRPFIACGPRDNRSPLQRGRTLSTEAILAVQSLKRAQRDPGQLASALSKTLGRLIKPDLVAALRELLRQNRPQLALHVFALIRREPWYKTDYGLYVELVSALGRSEMWSEIDGLVRELVEEGFCDGDAKAVERLIKALIAAERGKALVDLYGMMKRAGRCLDDYGVRVLCRGLRRLGETATAEEVEQDFRLLEEREFGKLTASNFP